MTNLVASDRSIELSALQNTPLRGIGTLGPTGTSSEHAALALWRSLDREASVPVVRLFDTYEIAADALVRRRVSHIVVANAYAEINRLYMSSELELAGAFVYDTPPYGVAAPPLTKIPARPVIASHPAPVPLLNELLLGQRTWEVVLVSSTSQAAAAAQRREVDLALTTQPAAAEHGLSFISSSRPIRMLWSIFVRHAVSEHPGNNGTSSVGRDAVPSNTPATLHY
ncbi:MAG TPA: hypothetical protein VI248_11005 [Kineosporiaceae bacterium]